MKSFCVIALALIIGFSGSSGASPIKLVGLSGAAGVVYGLGPGIGNNTEFGNFGGGGAVLSRDGRLLFQCTLTGSGVVPSTNQAIFEFMNDDLTLLVQEGPQFPCPGLPPGNYFNFSYDTDPNLGGLAGIEVGNEGIVSLHAKIAGPGVTTTTNDGFFKLVNGTFQTVVRTGGTVPIGSGNGTLVALNSSGPMMNSRGDLQFEGAVRISAGGSPRTGKWLHTPAGLSVFALQGVPGPIPGPNLGGSVSFTTLHVPRLSEDGSVCFIAGLSDSSVQPAGLWTTALGGLDPIAIRQPFGQPYDPDASLYFRRFGGANTNATGDIIFSGIIIGPGVNSTNNSVVGTWTREDGTRRLARIGHTSPVADPLVTFSAISNHLISDDRVLSIVGQISGPGISAANDSGIWHREYQDGSEYVQLVREGNPAPGDGLPPDAVFDDLYLFGGDNPVRMADGKFLFYANVRGTGINSTNNFGLFFTSGQDMISIIREGDVIDVNPGAGQDLRTVLVFYSSLTEHNNQRLAIEVTFTDETHAMILAEIPEPSYCILMPALLLLRRFRSPARSIL